MLIDELLDDRDVLSHRGRAHLLVIAHHHHPARHVEGDQRHHVGLAGLVGDDHVEARGRLEGFHRAGERHDPDRHRRSALGHLLARFDDQAGNALAHSLANPADHVEPSHQRLLLLRRGPPHLRRPGAAFDQLRRHPSQRGAQPVDLRLESGERGLPSALQLVVKLPPQPGGLRITRGRRLVVRWPAFLDCLRPCRRHRLQGSEKLPPA